MIEVSNNIATKIVTSIRDGKTESYGHHFGTSTSLDNKVWKSLNWPTKALVYFTCTKSNHITMISEIMRRHTKQQLK